MNKRLKILLILLLAVVGLAIAFCGYCLHSCTKDLESAKRGLQTKNEELHKQLSASKQSLREAENKSLTEPAFRTTCPSILSSEEQSFTSSWKMYKNSSKHYSFRYPSSWSVTGQGDEIVLAFAPSSINMRITSGGKANVDLSKLNEDRKERIAVDCQSATETFYSSDIAKTIATTFKKGSTPFVITFSYEDQGASSSSDMISSYNLILKTMALK